MKNQPFIPVDIKKLKNSFAQFEVVNIVQLANDD